jgi:hypothetical protein
VADKCGEEIDKFDKLKNSFDIKETRKFTKYNGPTNALVHNKTLI